jgi:hypothetical protein
VGHEADADGGVDIGIQAPGGGEEVMVKGRQSHKLTAVALAGTSVVGSLPGLSFKPRKQPVILRVPPDYGRG